MRPLRLLLCYLKDSFINAHIHKAAKCAGVAVMQNVVLNAAMSNMCRDEITGIFKTKLDIVFGSSFNTNGLGGVLTCGVTGVKAGLSHSPISAVGIDTLSERTSSCAHYLLVKKGEHQQMQS